jgi:hypothetical protein
MPFEKVIVGLSNNMNTINKTISLVFTGKHNLLPGEKAGPAKRIADIGLLGILDVIASVDLCNILSYGSNQALAALDSKANKFDPKKKPDTDNIIAITRWNIQKVAYEIQSQIDAYHSQYGELINPTQLNKLIEDLVKQLIEQQVLSRTNLTKNQQEELAKSMPGFNLIENFIDNAIGYFNNIPSLEGALPDDIKKVITYIEKIRNICVKIQALASPASFAASWALNTISTKDLEKLNKIIDPKKVVPVIKNIIQSAQAIQKTISSLLSIVRTFQVFLNIAISIVTVLIFILRFFKILPAPTMFATVGVTNTTADAQATINALKGKLVLDLQAISAVLSSLVDIFTTLSANIGIVIEKLNIIILNLESCENAPQDLIDELKGTRDGLVASKAEVDAYVNNRKTKKENKNKSIGEYDIIIQTEQVSSTNIRLFRRYGIALDKYGVLAAQSTPTFASSDNIIIQEVKLLLISKGLIKSMPSNLSPDELAIIEDALSFMEGDNNFDDNASLEEDIIDAGDNEDENQGIGLNAFINKLKGGKSLRRRVRGAMNTAKTKLQNQVGTQSQNKLPTAINGVDKGVGQASNENSIPPVTYKLLTQAERDKYHQDLIKYARFKYPWFQKTAAYRNYHDAEKALKEDKLAGGPG